MAANPDWTAEQIAQSAGCSAAYIYKLRRTTKKKPVATSDAVTDFYRALKRVGVARAKELIAAVEEFRLA